MKKILIMSIFLCLSLFSKEVTLSGNIVSTHDAAGGGYGIQTQKGVYGLCYNWDNQQMVDELNKLEQSGQKVELSGKQIDKWSIDCNSIKFANKPIDNLNYAIKEYTKCLLDNNFECQIKFMDKTVIKEMTGEEVDEAALLRELKNSGIKVTNLEMSTPSKIIKNGSILTSKVIYSAIVKIQGERIEQKQNLNAISKDNGLTWLFSQGNDDDDDTTTTGTHCKNNENIVFSCDTGKKVVSVCSSKNQSNKYIQYRFGKLGNPEALIPKKPENFYNSVSAFHLNVGGTAEAKGIEFTNGAYLYGINSTSNYFYVRKNDKDIAELNCKKDTIDNIDIQYLKDFGLKTETDE